MTKINFYFDEMMSRPAADELKKRGYDVIMAIDVGMTGKTDPEHLRYATEQSRVLVTFDRPFANLTSTQTDHAGLVCLTFEEQNNVGRIVRLLSEFAEQDSAKDAAGKVFWRK